MGKLQITAVVAAIGTAFALSSALAAPNVIHQDSSLVVPAKVTCPKWCGKWKTVWVTKANGFTTKSRQCEFWVSSCTDDGR